MKKSLANKLSKSRLLKAAVQGDLEAQELLRKAIKDDEDAKAKAKARADAKSKDDSDEDEDEDARDEEDEDSDEDEDEVSSRTRTRARSRSKAAKARDDEDEDEDEDEYEDELADAREYAKAYANAFMRARAKGRSRAMSKAAADDFTSWASSPRSTPSRLGNPTGEPGRTTANARGLDDSDGPAYNQGDGGWADTSAGEALGAGRQNVQVRPADIDYWLQSNGLISRSATARGLTPAMIAQAWRQSNPPKPVTLGGVVPALGGTVHPVDGQAGTFDVVVKPL